MTEIVARLALFTLLPVLLGAALVLFDRTTTGCRVRADGTLSGSGPWAAPVAVAGRLAGPAIGHDLRRVGDILGRGRRTP